MTFFKKITKDDGTEEFVEVELTAEDVPEEVVKQTSAYKGVLDETIARRKEKAELKKKLTEVSKTVVVEGDEPESEPKKPESVGTPPVELDKDALYTEFVSRLTADQIEKAQKEAERKANIQEIAKKHGLGEKALPLLENAVDPEKQAKALLAAKFVFSETDGGEPGTGAPGSDFWSKLDEKLDTGVKSP